MDFKLYKQLPIESKHIRQTVFIDEQGFENEFDNIDEIATHIVVFNDNKPIATCRVFFDEPHNAFMIGRIAVLKEFRSKHIGEMLMNIAHDTVKEMGGDCIMLSAQVRASEFYKKQGYTMTGDEYDDEGVPHILMVKDL